MFRLVLCAALSLAVSAQEVEFFERALAAIVFSNDTNETNETLIKPAPAPPPAPEPAPEETPAPPTAAPLPSTKYEVTAEVEDSAAALKAAEDTAAAQKAACTGECTVTVTTKLEVSVTADFADVDCDTFTADKTVAAAAVAAEVEESAIAAELTPGEGCARRLADGRRLATGAMKVALTITFTEAQAALADSMKSAGSKGIAEGLVEGFAAVGITVAEPVVSEPKMVATTEVIVTAASADAAPPAAISSEAIAEATGLTVEVSEPETSGEVETPAPPAYTGAPTSAEEEDSGATLERAGLLTFAVVALTTIVTML